MFCKMRGITAIEISTPCGQGSLSELFLKVDDIGNTFHDSLLETTHL